MFQYAVKRLLLLAVTLTGIMALTFVLTRLTPGDPAALRLQAGSGATQAVGGYDDLVERNRRNLGLDRPLILNLRFENRRTAATQALDDYLRRGDFWRRDGRNRLARMSTIALGPALERFELIGTPDEPVPASRDGTPRDMATPEVQRRLLAELFPSLAAQSAADHPGHATPEEAHAYWSSWYEEHRARFGEETVRALVRAYITAETSGEAERMEAELRRAGGFAVQHLARHLGSGELTVQRRLNRALQAQTGFTFAASDQEFEERAGEIMQRWRSWWRRDWVAYSEPSAVRHAINIFANTQFGLWTIQALTFDFGDSYAKRRPVIRMIAEALPISVLLSGLSILISYLIAIPMGIFSAVKKHTPADHVTTVILFILYSLPSFWVAGLLLLTTTGPPFLSLFPTRGLNTTGVYLGAPDVTFMQWLADRAWHLILPVTCLTYGSLAYISRQMRSAMLETLNQDFIRTAQAKGLSGSAVIFKHALRNSLIPVLTISAGLLPELIAGAIIIESIFTIPGMGVLTFEAIVNRDYPVINAVLFFSAFLTLLGILIVDLSYALVDPRITYR